MNERVLIIDDEREFALTLADRLAARGCLAEAAGDGDEGLDYLRRRDVDVVILDLNMPGKNGMEVFREIKEVRPYTEVVMLTGSSSLENAVTGMKLGMVDYLIKPTDIDKLTLAVREAKARRISREERLRMMETEKMATLGVLAEGVAHEINNPVNVIVQAAGWLEDLIEDDVLAECESVVDDFKENLRTIRHQGERCKRITSKLLRFGGRIDRRPQNIDLNVFLSDLVEKHELRGKMAGVRIRLETCPDLPTVKASPTELEQTFGNILENAFEALENQDEGRIRITLAHDEDRVFIAIHDTGPGIAVEILPRVFEPFFSTKQVGKGAGLGLSIAYGVITALRGDIAISSPVGQGTTVRVSIPA